MFRTFVPPRLSPVAPMREQGIVVLVDARGKPVDRIAFRGETQYLRLPWRRIMRAIMRSRCRGIILLHSHTSQDASPSAADIRVTRRLTQMLSPLGVELCDHMIVAGPRHFSFRSEGLM